MNEHAATPPVVLITGASSGFGEATARHLAACGWRVFGTSRKATWPSEAAGPLTMVPLDVRNEESVRACVDGVLTRAGRIDALVNNAGYPLAGAVEETSIEESLAQFQTNFFGPCRMLRAVLPVMRRQGDGRIVTVTSLAGMIGVPFHAHYSATKFALEGLHEGLRQEVRGFGIQVSMIEPGDFKTAGTFAREWPARKIADYDANRERAVGIMARSEQSGPDPIKLARLVESILAAKRPKLRYRVGLDSKWVPRIRRVIPESLFERILRSNYKIDHPS